MTEEYVSNFAMDEKILGLLSKAESTTPEEAELLTAKAEELMIKFGIQRAIIDAKRRGQDQAADEVIVEEQLHFVGIYRDASLLAAHRVASALDTVRTLSRHEQREPGTGKRSVVLILIGFESDVRQASLLIRSLQLQCVTALGKWWRGLSQWDCDDIKYRKAEYRSRRDFVQAFGLGAWERIRWSRLAVIQEYRGSGVEVALRDRMSDVDRYLSNIATLPARRHRWESGSMNAQLAGREAGRSADVGEKRVTGTRTQIQR